MIRTKSIPKEIRKYVDYNPETGMLTWKINNGKVIKGDIIRTKDPNGYLQFMFNHKTYRAHRVCYFLYHNRQPKGIIDHLDGDRSNNIIKNLSLGSVSDNSRNQNAIEKVLFMVQEKFQI